jgi:hypothetical protein
MKYIFSILILITLFGCAKNPETSSIAGKDFKVDTLFTHEGCRVYRFSDAGNFRYYSDCRGETFWTEGCGKGCSREVTVSSRR